VAGDDPVLIALAPSASSAKCCMWLASILMLRSTPGPDDLRIEVAYPNARQTTSALLGDVRAESEPLLASDLQEPWGG
jgi:hypothetical protein